VDQRRFLTWLMLTSALFFLYMSMQRPVPPKQLADEVPVVENSDPLLQEDPRAKPDPAATVAEIGEAPLGVPLNPGRVLTLGSMDPTKKFNMLVTLSTRGAGLIRAEMVEYKTNGKLRYRALEHDGSYLGYLALTPVSGGMRINSVPDGSPAALAKSQDTPGSIVVDDVLTSIGDEPVDSLAGAQAVLQKIKPRTTVQLSVQRQVNGTLQKLNFSTDTIEAPLDVLRTEEFETDFIVGNKERPSLMTTLGSLNNINVPPGMDFLPAIRQTLYADWAVTPLEVENGQGFEFKMPLDSYLANTGRPNKIDLVKRYRLLPVGTGQDGYTLDLETLIVNRNDQPIDVSFRQQGLNGLTLEGWWYSVKISPDMFASAGQRDVIFKTVQVGHDIHSTRELVDNAKKNPKMPDKLLVSEGEPLDMRTLKYIGLDAQYFCASILPHPTNPQALTNLRQAASSVVADVNALNKSQVQGANTSFWFDTTAQSVPAGAEISQRYEVFIGPKVPALLELHGLDRAIEYGWFPWVAKPLSWILHFFYAIVRNYGIAIIMLTVMVRGAMFPLGRKAAMSAQRMQEMQPELKKINELYKDNMEKRGKAMQELYKKHNFQPLAGCLPMFIQLPIFLGLYRCLSVDISLRQEPLLPGLDWCSNLASPDMLMHWGSWMPDIIAGRGTGWFGPYFNILPLITVSLFLLQQKILMPKATDEQTQMTQNMMQIMTVFMGVLFFKVPSGLCIYFITSSIWSLVERKLVKRFTPPPKQVETPVVEAKPTGNGEADKNGRKKNRQAAEPAPEKSAMKTRLDELRSMLDKPAVRSATQRDSRKDKKRKK
jgi:YidC/Oxa1 family membrane protein insertase